jgi:hypothetical protein
LPSPSILNWSAIMYLTRRTKLPIDVNQPSWLVNLFA